MALALVLVLRAYDMAGVSQHQMQAAERAAAAVFDSAGIQLAWVPCHPGARHALDSGCNHAPDPFEFIIRIVPEPAVRTNVALADATVNGAAGGGTLATIYMNRVKSLAWSGRMDPGTLMGRAIAHEVGHLLLGAASHSGAGLMRSLWSASMLRQDPPAAWLFSEDEAARLRARLGDRELEVPITRTAVVDPRPPLRPPCTKPRALAYRED